MVLHKRAALFKSSKKDYLVIFLHLLIYWWSEKSAVSRSVTITD